MHFRISYLLLGLILLGGCVETGYQPKYIISDTSQEEVLDKKSPQ